MTLLPGALSQSQETHHGNDPQFIACSLGEQKRAAVLMVAEKIPR
jgi:hypothetical protein